MKPKEINIPIEIRAVEDSVVNYAKVPKDLPFGWIEEEEDVA
jgi:hypothetical protein